MTDLEQTISTVLDLHPNQAHCRQRCEMPAEATWEQSFRAHQVREIASAVERSLT